MRFNGGVLLSVRDLDHRADGLFNELPKREFVGPVPPQLFQAKKCDF